MRGKAVADSCNQVPNLQSLAFSIEVAESKECVHGDAEGAERRQGYPRLSRVLYACGHPCIECLGIQAEQKLTHVLANSVHTFLPSAF